MGALVILLMFATLAVLVSGVILMGAGGAANTRYGNKLMVVRVWCQGLALLLLAVVFLMSGK